MISVDEAYLLGLLLSKGNIINLPNNQIVLVFKVKFRRPSDGSLRSDNIHTRQGRRQFFESLRSRLSNDFLNIVTLLRNVWGIESRIILPGTYEMSDWNMKEIEVYSSPITNRYERLCDLLRVDVINAASLLKFPYHLNMEQTRSVALGFIQGVCDACSLVPNEASSSYGGTGNPRIQLEPNQERWELPIGLCMLFQETLGISVNNINWGHPQIRKYWRFQNHQFRVNLSSIPSHIELYRLAYKREEYSNLYRRHNIVYRNEELCPQFKRVHEGETLEIYKSNNADLVSPLLDERLRGLSIDVSQKKSIIICKLLGCRRCENYFDLVIRD